MIDAPRHGLDLVLALAVAEARRQAGSTPDTEPPGDRSATVPLPPPCGRVTADLSSVIERRRSCGAWQHGTLRQAELSALLQGLVDGLPPYLDRVRPVICPVVFSVDQTPIGCYRYMEAEHALAPIGGVVRTALERDLLVQPEHGKCAVIIFLVAALSRWLHLEGDMGYRSAVLQQGWIADRLYLRAESVGLSYTASGGFAASVADEVLGLDGLHFTALFSFLVGVGSEGDRAMGS